MNLKHIKHNLDIGMLTASTKLNLVPNKTRLRNKAALLTSAAQMVEMLTQILLGIVSSWLISNI